MIIGIDNSGNPNDKFWVISLIFTENAQRIVKEAWNELGKKVPFHASHDDKNVRRVFIDALVKNNVKGEILYVTISEKEKIKRILKEIICSHKFMKPHIFFDNPFFQNLRVGKEFLVSKDDGEKYAPVQIADYFSHSWWRTFNGNVDEEFYQILSITERVYFLFDNEKITFKRL